MVFVGYVVTLVYLCYGTVLSMKLTRQRDSNNNKICKQLCGNLWVCNDKPFTMETRKSTKLQGDSQARNNENRTCENPTFSCIKQTLHCMSFSEKKQKQEVKIRYSELQKRLEAEKQRKLEAENKRKQLQAEKQRTVDAENKKKQMEAEKKRRQKSNILKHKNTIKLKKAQKRKNKIRPKHTWGKNGNKKKKKKKQTIKMAMDKRKDKNGRVYSTGDIVSARMGVQSFFSLYVGNNTYISIKNKALTVTATTITPKNSRRVNVALLRRCDGSLSWYSKTERVQRALSKMNERLPVNVDTKFEKAHNDFASWVCTGVNFEQASKLGFQLKTLDAPPQKLKFKMRKGRGW